MIIDQLKLKAGRVPNAPADNIDLTPVTVFVGPNNSGKSKVLSEIDQACWNAGFTMQNIVLDSVRFKGLSNIDDARKEITKLAVVSNPGEQVNVGHSIVQSSRRGRMQVLPEDLASSLLNPSSNLYLFSVWLGAYTLMLGGANRIALVGSYPAGDLQQGPQNAFQTLFSDDIKRGTVSRIVYDAFGKYFVIDPTNIGQLRARLSDKKPISPMEERGIHAEAVSFHSEAMLMDEASDGVKAFSGIITQIIAGNPRVIIIDEPEAFLHPALAFKLGQEIASSGNVSGKNVFVSTHSPNFLMGCLQSGIPMNIVRLTYINGAATARVLPSQNITEMMRNPLLRSTGVISGLFYEFVIVTESDADRAFYQEINERLVREKSEWGIPNCLFLNAQNKQTIRTIIRPLRQLGIPAAGIVDVDVFKDGGADWTKLLESAFVPQISHQPLGQFRAAVKDAMIATGKNMKRDGGISILTDAEKEAAENLISQLNDYGVFVVPGGELESWQKNLGATGHGPPWLIDIFEKMGSDPVSTNYVKPSDDDVWRFISVIKRWLVSPQRKGIPY